MTYVIVEPCVDNVEKACLEVCPVDCIYQGDRMLYINPDECVDCAACEPMCPVGAIFPEDQVPTEWSPYVAVNAEFFTDAPDTGTVASPGKAGSDHALVMALPATG